MWHDIINAMIDPLNDNVMALLKKTTGIDSAEAWRAIWLLISKSEHDNEDPDKAFLTDGGKSLFGYASALSYDCKDRGVTMGAVGWTTGCDGKDGEGDAGELFRIYKELGGDDFRPLMKGCCSSKEAREKLIKKIDKAADDPAWVHAQWTQLVTKADDGAYLYHTMKAWKDVGVDRPSPLAIATVFDASLNQGYDGKDGGCANLRKLGVHGDEDATLKKYNAWRAKTACRNAYNDPPANGTNRAHMFEELRKAKAYSLTGREAAAAIKKAIHWTMK